MACGTCGQRRQVMEYEQAQALVTGVTSKYIVTTPDGDSKTFERYIDAVVYKRQNNGTLTTTTS